MTPENIDLLIRAAFLVALAWMGVQAIKAFNF